MGTILFRSPLYLLSCQLFAPDDIFSFFVKLLFAGDISPWKLVVTPTGQNPMMKEAKKGRTMNGAKLITEEADAIIKSFR